MSFSGNGKYILSVATVIVFLWTEYSLLHQYNIVYTSTPPHVQETTSSRTTTSESSNPAPTAGVVTETNGVTLTPVPLFSASEQSKQVPVATPTISPQPTLAPLTISPTPVPPTITPDCLFHEKNNCGVLDQTIGKIKETKQKTTQLIKPLGL